MPKWRHVVALQINLCATTEFKDDMSEEIEIAILTETISQLTKSTGTYANSKVAKEIIETVVEGDKKIVEENFNTLIDYYNILNRGKIDTTKFMLF